ncbi:HAD-IA family hydrolase [Phaeocystidibacter luteus]|uniref:HAD-IA family hydrolase n=1 Tax=Phaeocystidibacter luteus TaxID=911197 RepID=A0A6N6RFS2_9FLAO|nr:HAD-IA family hydrolase [Phaeocystidibacter luteus]KAB2807043.1 HAD-IA family hydrolase [Phaeocystidibacter luteus]
MKENILIDLGGILIDLDFNAMHDAFEALGVREEPAKSDLQKYETGKMSTADFYSLWQTSNWVMKSDINHAWNALLLDIPEERIALLKKLSRKHRLYLVSNTNELHINAIKSQMGIFGWNQFSKLFEKMYFSHEVGNRKPNKAFFESILKDAGLSAEDCSFIDDTKEHVDAAAKLGMDAHYVNLEEETILDLDIAR